MARHAAVVVHDGDSAVDEAEADALDGVGCALDEHGCLFELM